MFGIMVLPLPRIVFWEYTCTLFSDKNHAKLAARASRFAYST